MLGVHEGEDRKVRVRAEADLDRLAGGRRGGQRGGEDGVGDSDAQQRLELRSLGLGQRRHRGLLGRLQQ